LETSGKEIEDEGLRYAMKDSGLGTPATLASIIKTLITQAIYFMGETDFGAFA